MSRWDRWRDRALKLDLIAIAFWAAVVGLSLAHTLGLYDEQSQVIAQTRARMLSHLAESALTGTARGNAAASLESPIGLIPAAAADQIGALTKDSDALLHLTGLGVPPAGALLAPDDWERSALAALPLGGETIEPVGEMFRYIRVLQASQICPSCAGASDAKGGIGVSIPVEQVVVELTLQRRQAIGLHALAFAVFVLGSVILIERTRYQWRRLIRTKLEQDRVISHRTTELRREMAGREVIARKLEEKLRELRRSNEELESFAYAASHDLQEPLRMVSSYAALIKKRYADRLDEDGQEFLGYLSEGARRMKTMIDDLLAYSRVDRGQIAHHAVDLRQVMDRAEANLAVAMGETNADIDIGPLPTVWGDASLLARLLQNLVSNAVKYRSPDRRLRITIAAVPLDDRWEISISDNGMGIPEEGRHRLFQLFQRFHDRSTSGNGMGLAICRKIVERHGGEIWVDSINGKGSVFHFTLPAVAAGQRGDRAAVTANKTAAADCPA